jgi:hypothetical protein
MGDLAYANGLVGFPRAELGPATSSLHELDDGECDMAEFMFAA